MNNFGVNFYETSSGRKIISDFINSFSHVQITKIHNDLDLLKDYGLKLLNTPLVKKIYKKPSIYELRIKTKVEIRLLFYFHKPKNFVVLHGFIKKTNKTPRKDIELALKRLREFI